MTRAVFVGSAFLQLGPARPITLVLALAGKPNWRGTGDLAASKAVAAVARPSRGHCQATLVTCLVDVHLPAASADLRRVARTFPVAVALLCKVLLCRWGVAAETFF